MGKVAFSWHPPNPDSSIGLLDGEVGFITPENAFPLLQSPMVASFTPLQPTLGIAHGDLRLVRLLGRGNKFNEYSRQTFIVLTLLPEEVWNSVVSVAAEDR